MGNSTNNPDNNNSVTGKINKKSQNFIVGKSEYNYREGYLGNINNENNNFNNNIINEYNQIKINIMILLADY